MLILHHQNLNQERQMDRGNYIISYEAMESFIGFIHEGVIFCSDLGDVVLINKPALEIFGLSNTADILGMSIGKLLDKEYLTIAGFLKQVQQKAPVQNQIVLFLSGEKKIRCSISASPIENLATGQIFTCIIFHDVDRQENAEKKLELYAARLERSNKELDQFAYIVSHDLKAPLRAIMNLSQWLQEDLESVITGNSRKNLEMLRNRTVRMEALITGILDYSKIGRSKIQMECLDIEGLVADVVESLMPPEHFVIEIFKLPMVIGPKIMLYQVFSNLIGNAIKYNNKAAGVVKIHAAERPDSYEFTVEDNGPGIAKEFYDTVFIIFQTLQSRDKIESTGIGLTIVKRIIEENGGKIWIESESGMGSKFIFQWPKKPVTSTQI